MTEQAQNYLLKTIEEPPENVVLYFTDNKQKLLPTIRSPMHGSAGSCRGSGNF